MKWIGWGDSKMGTSNLIELASEIVAAFVSNNPLPKGELPSLILAVHAAVVRLAAVPESVPLQIEVKTPRCLSAGLSPQTS